MITNEKEYLQGRKDCKEGKLPVENASESYCQGYTDMASKLELDDEL